MPAAVPDLPVYRHEGLDHVMERLLEIEALGVEVVFEVRDAPMQVGWEHVEQALGHRGDPS